MNILQVYKVHGDGGERGIGPIIGITLTKDKAEQMCKGKGFFGSHGEIFNGFAIEGDNGELYLLESEIPYVEGQLHKTTLQNKKNQALAKLTEEDKKVLGLL